MQASDVLQAPRSRATAASSSGRAADPVEPVLPQISLGRSVGRNGKNRVADVRLVQDRLLTLCYLSQEDHAREIPAAGATGSVPADRLGATIAAIENVQREVLGSTAPDGQVGPSGNAIKAVNRAIPRPTASDYTAVATATTGISQTITRGVTVTGPVGDAPKPAVTKGEANRPADVTAVQQRLVQLGYLSSTHTEQLPSGATASIQSASLQQTVAAIKRFQQRRVNFWRGRGEVKGAITQGVVAPGDATQRLLDKISTYREQFATGEDISFDDLQASQYTKFSQGTSVTGIAKPAALPAAEYAAIGLTPAQTNALRFVSEHEGNFDALNTYDQARVSFGFIQFAGGRGLPPFMALLKSRRPEVFERVFGTFGIDVEFNVVNGNIANAAVVLLVPANQRVLRGADAEGAIRDNQRLSAAFIRAGRNVEVQRVQVEAATRDYVLNSLATQSSYEADLVEVLDAPGGAVTETHAGSNARAFRATPKYGSLKAANRLRERRATTSAPIEALLLSEPGIAVLMDRAIQDGAGPRGGGVLRIIGAMRWVAEREGLSDITQIARRERIVLQQVVDDFAADADISDQIDAALAAVGALRRAAEESSATVAGVVALQSADAARQALDRATAIVPRKSFVTVRTQLANELPAQRTRLDFATPPPDVAALKAELRAVSETLGRLQKPVRADNARAKRRRVEDLFKDMGTAPAPASTAPVPAPGTPAPAATTTPKPPSTAPTSAAAAIVPLLSYSGFDWEVSSAEEAKILGILRADTHPSRTVVDLNAVGMLGPLIDRVDDIAARRELLQILGTRVNATAIVLVEPHVAKLSLEWQLQFNLARLGITTAAPAFDPAPFASLISSSPAAPFTGVGATGVNPTTLDIPYVDQALLFAEHAATVARYHNPIPVSYPAYLATLTSVQRAQQAELLLRRPISSVEAASYVGNIPSRAQIVHAAATAHKLHPQLLAAFILTEQRDQSRNEDAKDYLAATSTVKYNSSIGLGQVVISTARRNDLFADLLSSGTRGSLDHDAIARLLASDEFNIFAAARYIRKVADDGSWISITTLPFTRATFPGIVMAAYAGHSSTWPDDNIRALGSEYTSKPWDEALVIDWADFVFEAYRDVMASGVF